MISTEVMTKRKKSIHYVNNKEFLAALIQYKKEIKEAQERGDPKPRITNYLGECFLKIATHLSFKPNFVNYIFKDDMISDGIENCVQYIHNFDPEKSQNPFAYFTQIIHYAFLRRIQREKRQLEIKNKILEKTGFDEVFFDDNSIDGENYSDYNSIFGNRDIIQGGFDIPPALSLFNKYIEFLPEISKKQFQKGLEYSKGRFICDIKLAKYNEEDDLNWHSDDWVHYNHPYKDAPYIKRQFTCITYLNDNFVGGETEFEFELIIPKENKTLIFPSNWQFAHKGNKIIKGTKYIYVNHIWF